MKFQWRIRTVATLLTMILLPAAADRARAEEAHPPTRPMPFRPPAGNPQLPQGSTAIKPRTTETPSFTLDDAREFVATHRMPLSTSRDAQFSITRAEFMTSKQVTTLLHGASTGFPADYPLCYVELSGTFTFSGPKGATATYHRGIEIFDAHTGNFLMGGGLP